jgi:hypothetical protein
VSAQSAMQRVLKCPSYANGMEEAVVDVVVIQWIMQKLQLDRTQKSASQLNVRSANLDDSN